MSSTEDSFNLNHLVGQPASAEHFPEAAAAARAKIAALPDPHTSEATLVTDKTALVAKHRKVEKAADKPPRKHRQLPSRIRPILTGLATFAFLIAMFKAPIIISQLNYVHHNQTPITATTASSVVPPEATISIPKINVHAPVIYENNTRDENQILTDLQTGVVHYAYTAEPGQPGNAVIFGHSSEDWWVPGNYKFVFVLLDKLQPGDQFSVDYQSKRYVYQVTGSKVVEPTDLSVLNQNVDSPTMTLITCTPPGTSWKRLVVTGKQILPDPSGVIASKAPSPSGTPASLPGENSGKGLNKVSNFISGVWQSITGLFGGSDTPITSQQLPAAK
jgi:LPXTG-site transpeptidase (sortase) family protein